MAYNAGLGYVLHKQSSDQWLVKFARGNGFFDPQAHPRLCKWLGRELQAGLNSSFAVEVSLDPGSLPIHWRLTDSCAASTSGAQYLAVFPYGGRFDFIERLFVLLFVRLVMARFQSDAFACFACAAVDNWMGVDWLQCDRQSGCPPSVRSFRQISGGHLIAFHD
jgi:hypothetical protein